MEQPAAPAAQPKQATAETTPDPTATLAVTLQPTAPQRHVVVEGDTLWDISLKFLKEPWYWPEIWHANPQVKNPHLIYPGDVLTLVYVDGKPKIQLSGGPRITAQNSQRISPQIRVKGLENRDKGLPIQAIHQFMVRPRILTKEELDTAPYIVGSQDKRLIYGMEDIVYARKLGAASEGNRYSIYRPGKPLHDPNTKELLGYEALLVGSATVLKSGNPATVQLMRMDREALLGDRLLPFDDKDKDRSFQPHPPANSIDGTVISLFDAISQIGQYQVAVINLGTRDGIEKGHVLAISEAGRQVHDPFAIDNTKNKLALPDERSGIMMLFRVFEKLSYGLIMDATRPIRVGNTVHQP
ncbi:MAG: LysM peptidoglycan-binding domain-containing protein [Gammaproteobacteria bacterium]|nr:LysM peptidoglycan-binding domain-containing protein [Gammaproteobacteria bacterium]